MSALYWLAWAVLSAANVALYFYSRNTLRTSLRLLKSADAAVTAAHQANTGGNK